MRDQRNLLGRLQEYIDCFVEADPREAFREITRKGVGGDATGDVVELALKYLSLALIQAVEVRAPVLAVVHDHQMDGSVLIKMDGEEKPLPDPPTGVASEIAEILRTLTGIEGEAGEGSLSCGFRRERLHLEVEVEEAGAMEKVLIRMQE